MMMMMSRRLVQANRAISAGLARRSNAVRGVVVPAMSASLYDVNGVWTMRRGYHQTSSIQQEPKDVTSQVTSEEEAITYIQSDPLVMVSKSTCP